MRKLLFSNGSPFARRVRIILEEKGLEYERDVLDAVRTVDQIRPHNPALQVPVFFDNERRLFGSDLIVQYLLINYPNNTARAGEEPFANVMTRSERHWEDLQILTAIGSLTDSVVNIRLLEGATKDAVPYIARQELRIASLLDWLEPQVCPEGFWPGYFTTMDFYLFCPLVWGKHRGIFDYELGHWPNINAMIVHWKGRRSILATPIKPALETNVG